MNKLVNKLARELHERMKEPDGWGIIKLPCDYSLAFEFNIGCSLELQNTPLPNKKNITFSTLKNGNWITIKDFEKEIRKVFEKITFTEEEMSQYFEKIKKSDLSMDTLITIVTFGWASDKDCEKYGFDNEKYDNLDYTFQVPLKWLVGKYNIKNISEWIDNYTHEDGYSIYKEAVKEKVLV